MKNLWRPIAELGNIYDTNLLLRAPELVDLDFNPLGVAPGCWQDGPLTFGGDEPGEWIAAAWCSEHDHFVNRVCEPTHFIIMEGPEDAHGSAQGGAMRELRSARPMENVGGGMPGTTVPASKPL